MDSHTAVNQNGNEYQQQQRRRSDESFRQQEEDSLEMSRENQLMVASMGRQSPEGKDNMIVLPREQMMMMNSNSNSKAMDQYSADSNNNGKINVQVTVLFGEL